MSKKSDLFIMKGLSALKNNRKVALIIVCALLFICIALAYYDKQCLEIPANFSSGLYMTSTPIEVVDIKEPVDQTHGPLQDIGKCSYKKTVIIDGKKNQLLFTFDNPTQALANVKEKDNDILKKMAEKFCLDELDADNWKDYCCGILFDDKTDNDNDIGYQRSQLESFFDIYENDGQNSRTLKLVSQANDYMKIHGQAAIDGIISGLPWTDPVCR